MRDSDVKRAEELLYEARATKNVADLHEIVQELTELVQGVSRRASPADELARAVHAFAEWQHGRYGVRDAATCRVVGQQLWYEVSDRVCTAIGSIPAAPPFGTSRHDTE